MQLAPQHNCNMSKKSSEPIYTADSVLDLFSYHRNVAGIRAELLSCTDVDLECDPVDIGIIASAPEKGRIMMNCNTPNEAILRSTLLVVLEAFLVYLPSKTVDNGTGVSSFGTIKAWVDKHGSRSAVLLITWCGILNFNQSLWTGALPV